MGLISQAWIEIKEDLGLIKRPKHKFVEMQSRQQQIIRIESKKDILINSIRRHPNYYRVKYLVMDCVICNIDCVPSSRELEEVLSIGRSSISRQLLILHQEGLIQRLKLGDSNRSIYYKILVEKDAAILYRDTFTRSGRKKNKKY